MESFCGATYEITGGPRPRDEPGQIRVGRCKFRPAGGYNYPSASGFTPIVVLTKSSAYGALGPYVLKDESDRIMENIWQFSKLYARVPAVEVPFAARCPKIVWSWNEEIHVNEFADGRLTCSPMEATPNDAYWNWRELGMYNEEAVRYPVGRKFASNCLYAIRDRDDLSPLTYVQSRKQIYLPVYTRLARQTGAFRRLQERHQSGEDLLIIETDGPHQESLDYYRRTYDVGDDFIERDSMLASEDNIRIMLNDEHHAFGHGYCLAAALQGFADRLSDD